VGESAFSLRQNRQNHEVDTIFTTQPAAAPVPSLKLTNSLAPQNGWNWNTFIVSFLKLYRLGAYFQGVCFVRFREQNSLQESYADYQKRRQEHHEKMEPEAGYKDDPEKRRWKKGGLEKPTTTPCN